MAAFVGQLACVRAILYNVAGKSLSPHNRIIYSHYAGNTTITRLILEAGAKTTPVNSVGRTATQMAAFVGQHACVSLINNFFSVDDLAYYTKPQGKAIS